MRISDSLGQICKLVGNLGPADKSTNFILEQRNLLRSQAEEDRDIREAIKSEVSLFFGGTFVVNILVMLQIVDGLEYIRTKEKIALTKQRVKDILSSNSDSEDEAIGPEQSSAAAKDQPSENKTAAKLQNRDEAASAAE